MNKINKNILSEILLEITLTISNEKEYDAIMKTTLALWLRRMSCTKGAILKIVENKIEKQFIIPSYLANNPSSEKVQSVLLHDKIDFFKEVKEDGVFHYIFPLQEDLFFLFSRTIQLKRAYCREIFPVTQFFAKALENAVERNYRKTVESQLDEERALLRAVIDHLPDAVYLKNLQLQKILTNKADLKNIGAESEEQVLFKTDHELFGEVIGKDSEEIEKAIIASGEEVIDREELLLNKKGETGWLLSSKVPIKDASGKITSILGISRNITQSKAAAEQIKRLSLVASQTTNGVVITNIEGKIEWINDGFTRLTGYEFEEVRGRKPGSFLQGPASSAEQIDIMKKAIAEERSFKVELINYKKDGSPYWIQIDCNPMRDENNELKGFMAIESDISERVIFQEELIKAKQEAEKAQEAEKSFLANMSHEIRTPLNAIIGMTSLLRMTETSNEQVDYIDTLEQSSRFLLRLISDILDIVKIEAGKIEIKKEHFDIHKTLKSIHQTFLLKATDKQIAVTLDIEKSIPQFLVGDELLLQQVLNNLMSNAEKFTFNGAVHLKVYTQRKGTDMSELCFEVEDSGVGMTKTDLAQIFLKFKQAKQNNNLKKQGTGLGLAITKQIVELLGGNIYAESIKGQGSTFKVTLPFQHATKESGGRNSHELPSQIVASKNSEREEQFKVLVAEDNLVNQLYISRLMDKLGWKYEVANNGKEAVEKALHHMYSVILMDIQMPEMDGYEATKIIRKLENPNKDTPIIALTASALLEFKELARESGMNEFLTKPFTPEQLKDKLQLFNLPS